VQVVAPAFGDLGMQARDARLRLLSVRRDFSTCAAATAVHGAVQLPGAGNCPGVRDSSVGQRGEAGYAHVDADDACRLRRRYVDLAPRLDGKESAAVSLTDGDVLQRSQDLAAVPVPDPAKLRQEDAAIPLVQLELLGERIAEAVTLALHFEVWEIGSLGEEV